MFSAALLLLSRLNKPEIKAPPPPHQYFLTGVFIWFKFALN